jgi:hypothetical protein
MKRYFLIFSTVFLMSGTVAFSQEESESPFSVTTDIYSRYLWRGTDFGGSPAIQPGLSYSKGGFTAGAWASYTTNGNQTQECDLYLSYTFLKEMLTVTATDYFFPVDGAMNKYFNYNDTTTGHIFEMAVAFNGTEKLPLGILVATNLYGADPRKDNGDPYYSTYIEANYQFKHVKLFAGFNPIESGFYGDYLGFCNIGATAKKEIKITDNFSVPVSVSLITNPQKENIFLVVGASF